MLVKDLKPRSPFDQMNVEVVSKGEMRSYANANGSGNVCSCAAKDEEGTEISLTLWNEQCTQVNEGDKLKITNGWVSEFKGTMQISTGKKGALEVLKK